MIEKLKEQRIFDFNEAFSIPFAVSCISKLVGLDLAQAQKLHHWSNMFFYLFHSIQDKETLSKVNAAIEEFRDVIKFQLLKQRHNHEYNFLSMLTDAEINGHRLDDEQIVDNIMLILADAIGNVHTGLTSAVFLLLRHEDQKEKLIHNSELITSAVQECIRFESPAQYQGRISSETFELNGTKIRKNFVVLLALGSANRDPAFVDDPDRFDIERRNAKSLSFGLGNHKCIGYNLVMAEFAAALSALFKKTHQVSLIDQDIEWIARSGHRWPKSLMIELR